MTQAKNNLSVNTTAFLVMARAKKSSLFLLQHYLRVLTPIKSYLWTSNQQLVIARRLIVTNPTLVISWLTIAALLFILPGQNYYQTLDLTPAELIISDYDYQLPPPELFPQLISTSQSPPRLSAHSAIVLDSDSAQVIYAKNTSTRLPPASTTKIMTALVALDEYALDDLVTVPNLNPDGRTIDLVPGEVLSVGNLITGMLVASGNDAALALAYHHPGGYQRFIALMNQKAQVFNLSDTRFTNPVGYDNPDHYTTVIDLARLSQIALKNPFFAQVVSTRQTTITDITGQLIHPLTNINLLLGQIQGLRGVKTGWTINAGECLVTSTLRENHDIIVVVLGSQNRFGETSQLINWAFANHVWVPMKKN